MGACVTVSVAGAAESVLDGCLCNSVQQVLQNPCLMGACVTVTAAGAAESMLDGCLCNCQCLRRSRIHVLLKFVCEDCMP